MAHTGADSIFFLDDGEEERPKIPQNDVDELTRKVRGQNQYSLEETKTRNVLMVGRTRSGKSTAVGVLKDPCFSPKEMSIFSDTVDPKFQSFALDDKTKSVKYTVNVIDTPGLKEVKQIGIDARSDEVIMNTINYCLKNEITKINTLLIFISFELGVTADDLNSFQTFLEKFSHDGITITVVITRSEDKTPQWKKDILAQLKQHPYFSKVLEKKNIHVAFLGCVDVVKNNMISNIEDLRRLYAKVYQMRQELLQIIFQSEQQVKLVDLPIASGVKNNMFEIFKLQNSILDYLDGISDFEVAAVKLKIGDFALNIDTMATQEAILYDAEMNDLFVKMKSRMTKLLAAKGDKMGKELTNKFVGKLVLTT